MASTRTKPLKKANSYTPTKPRAATPVDPALRICFTARLRKPAGQVGSWTFLNLPAEASAKLRSRGMVSVEGTLNSHAFRATLEPDGRGGHWLKVQRKLRENADMEAGGMVTVDIACVDKEPEPKVPTDLRRALAGSVKARAAWSDITCIARRDWVQWITSAKRPETRARRVGNACDMLAKGKRRPCCFDRSGMYAKSLACPVADDEEIGS